MYPKCWLVHIIYFAGKSTVDLRALGGYVNTHLTGFRVFYEDYWENTMTQKESCAGAFSFKAGADLKYDIAKKVSLHFNVDYFSSTPKIDVTYENFVVN